MSQSTFEVFDGAGQRAVRRDVHGDGPPLLHRLYRAHLHRQPCRFAVVRKERRANAIFLPDASLPGAAARYRIPRGIRGAWVTRALRLGDWGGGRVYLGPGIFFRQVDLAPSESWLALPLMRFPVEAAAEPLPYADRDVFPFRMDDGLFLYVSEGARWTLYGAGNTPEDRIRQIVAQERPESSSAYLWAIGAVRLCGSDRMDACRDVPQLDL